MERSDIFEGYLAASKRVQEGQAEQSRLFGLLFEGTTPAKPVQVIPATRPAQVIPPDVIALPGENELAKFYGEAVPEPTFLDWFNFPVDDVVLYTREGLPLSDRDGNGFDDHRIHTNLVEAIQDALATVYAVLGDNRFHDEGWHVYGGAFNYRTKKAGTSLSCHAYGAAIDINPNENPLYSDRTTFSLEAVEVMESFGFLWGPKAWGMPGYENPKHPGQWFDAMHFQAAIPYAIQGSWYQKNGWPKNLRLWKAAA